MPAMRTRLVVAVVLAAVLAACSGSSGGTASTANPQATNTPASTGQPADTEAPAGYGSVDCDALKTAAEQLIGIQLLAQLRSPDNVESIRNKVIGNLDLDAMLAALRELHALDGQSSVLGDPKAAIEVYEEAATAAKTLFATDPITQDAIDAYNEHVGGVAQFLGHQAAIAGAMDSAGC
jgi:hypothetical protein